MFLFEILFAFVAYPFIWVKDKITKFFGKDVNKDTSILP